MLLMASTAQPQRPQCLRCLHHTLNSSMTVYWVCRAGATLVVLSLGNLCALDFQVRPVGRHALCVYCLPGPTLLRC